MQSSTLSYKNKQIFHRSPEEQVLVKNTHEAIIDQELWDTVQRVREHKRRPPKHMDAPGLFEVVLLPQLYNARRFGLDLAPYPHIARIEAACLPLDAFRRAHPHTQIDNPERST